ncbi:MAG TPA: 50S ribosomal protein L25 [Candidatus Limnocylindrales bacterium]|nr:50S ribosomal protein L25 [Candidatus Limnocylindrales bacterium]
MSRPKISVRPRSVRGKDVSKLRRQGLLPAVVYGAGSESRPIEMDAHEFELLHRTAGRNAVVDLHIDGSRPQPVLLQSIQEHPVSRKAIHVDFLAVNMEEERTIDVPIQIVGESEAIDKMGGVLLHLKDTVQVRAKPDDIPSSIELDITSLVDFEHVLHASDLIIPQGVTLLTDETEPLARVQAPRVEEPEPTAEAADGEQGAEGADGETAEDSGNSGSAEESDS